MDKEPARENPRLKEYDHGTPGYYFVTMNTKKEIGNILSKIVPNPAVRAAAHGGPSPSDYGNAHTDLPIVILTPIGEMVRQYIDNINEVYDNAKVDEYAIMPNHVHLIIQITEPGSGPPWAAARTANLANLTKMMNSLKTLTSKKAGFSLWHRGFYDRVIRTEEDLYNTRRYVKYNASKHFLKQEEGHDTHA